MAIELIFSRPPATSGALVFGGDTDAPVSLDATVTFSGALGDLTGTVTIIPVLVPVGFSGSLGDLSGTFDLISHAVSAVGVSGALGDLSGGVALAVRAATTLGVAGALGDLSGEVTLVQVRPARLGFSVSLGDFSGTVTAHYDSRTERPLVCQSSVIWQGAAHHLAGQQERFAQGMPAPAGTVARWQSAAPRAAQQSPRWSSALRNDRPGARLRYQNALPAQASAASRFQDAQRQRHAISGRFERGLPVSGGFSSGWQETFRDRRPLLRVRYENGVGHAFALAAPAAYGLPLPFGFGLRYQRAMRPPAGLWIRPVQPLPGQPCYTPSAELLFSEPWAPEAPLLFICERHGPGPNPEPGAKVVVPILRTYIVINSITLNRVDTGAELHAHSFGMSLDYQSWTWSWSASLHHDAAAHLGRDSQGDPAELAVVVNGIPFRLRLESVTRDRRFSPTRWAVSGKGKASILGAPYAPTMSFGNSAPRTAQQLMADALTINGVSLGWSVDWGLTDWLVPAGAWALQGSYMDAINDIAAAAGGYVQPHPTDAVLRVLPRYPAAPWNWDSITPDFEIPADAAEVEGTQYIDKPAYNKVFVGGVGAGVSGPFKRAGTAGNILAPQVTHPLITHADAHRQRGLAELSDTGRQEHVTLKMQVRPETGVITPGQFVRYVGDKTVMGIVRSTSIDWSRPVLRQTIGIETHA